MWAKNRKTIIILIVILIIGIILGFAYGISRKKEEVSYITDNEFLYDVAIDYLKEKYTEEEKEYNEKQGFQIFFDYEGFGISEKDDKKFAYMWILEESYYVEDDKLKSGSGSSMPYKFTFEGNEVVDYQIPEDGTYYVQSIKKMFPDDIENKILKFNIDSTKLDNEVKEYYSKYNICFKVKEESLKNNGGTFVLENNTEVDYYYGPEYTIEVKKNDKWNMVEPKEILSWNSVLYTLESKKSQEINIDWSMGYENLEEGIYRIVKELTPKSDALVTSIKIYAEFEIK